MQRRRAVNVGRINAAARPKKLLHHQQVPLCCGKCQRGVFSVVAHVHLRAEAQQRCQRAPAPVVRRVVKCCPIT